jgi:hypothetical protein
VHKNFIDRFGILLADAESSLASCSVPSPHARRLSIPYTAQHAQNPQHAQASDNRPTSLSALRRVRTSAKTVIAKVRYGRQPGI